MKVKDILTGPEKWTQGACARDRNGESALATEAQPRYDLMGALIRCYGFAGYGQIYDAIRYRLGCSPVKWNDEKDRTFAEVRQLVLEMNL